MRCSSMRAKLSKSGVGGSFNSSAWLMASFPHPLHEIRVGSKGRNSANHKPLLPGFSQLCAAVSYRDLVSQLSQFRSSDDARGGAGQESVERAAQPAGIGQGCFGMNHILGLASSRVRSEEPGHVFSFPASFREAYNRIMRASAE
jgi:hypothetical protein